MIKLKLILAFFGIGRDCDTGYHKWPDSRALADKKDSTVKSPIIKARQYEFVKFYAQEGEQKCEKCGATRKVSRTIWISPKKGRGMSEWREIS